MSTLIIAVILFILLDILIRFTLKRAKEKKLKKERTLALDKGMQISFMKEAETLKRVEVENPKARILCVDDEAVILDSFRKILVMDGYSVDTVERGEEVPQLIRSKHYDFVYVDIKMPGMNGVEVTKIVKQVRPDIDVIIITGYASIETAVETMKFGAMDYVEKPFTEEELLTFTRKCVINRKDRIKRELGPHVYIADISEYNKSSSGEFSIPGGVFISKDHCWLSLQEDGSAKIGVDDFAIKLIGQITKIEPPNIGREITRGEPLFELKKEQHSMSFPAPISGKILKVNNQLINNSERINITCYGKNWICILDGENIHEELGDLKIGQSAIKFFQDQIELCSDQFKSIKEKRKEKEQNGYWWGKIEKLDDTEWKQLRSKLFSP